MKKIQIIMNVIIFLLFLSGCRLDILQLLLTDLEDPYVVDISPADNETGVGLSEPVTVTFSESMDTPSVEGAFTLSSAIGEQSIPGDIQWNSESTIFQYSPDTDFTESTHYNVTISTEAKDLEGNFLPSAFESSFITRNIPVISAGWEHTVANSYNGTLYSWGYNDYGQLGLGIGSDEDISSPMEIDSIQGIKNVECGNHHTLALDANGAVWAWGEVYKGKLGLDEDSDVNSPMQIVALSGVFVEQIDTGNDYSMALTDAGTIITWGNNFFGQLGLDDDEYDNSNTSIPSTNPINISDITYIGCGGFHAAALDNTNRIWIWGSNYYGQLGYDPGDDKEDTPYQISLTNIQQISTGYCFTMAVNDSNQLYTWGRNDERQLGYDPIQMISMTPAIVSDLPAGKTIKQVSAGYQYALVLFNDGSVYGWGNNSYRQLENSATSPVAIIQIPISDVIFISAGRYHSTAIKRDGAVWTWGAYNASLPSLLGRTDDLYIDNIPDFDLDN